MNDNIYTQVQDFLANNGTLTDAQKQALHWFADWQNQRNAAAWLKQHDKETLERIVYLEEELIKLGVKV